MTGPVVLDASALFAALADDGALGDWVASATTGRRLAAPELVMYETANILRRRLIFGSISSPVAARAHDNLLGLPLQLWPYRPLAARCWQLRANVTSYDAAYVVLAELLDAPLLTLDVRLARASGSTCVVRTPPEELRG